MGEYAEYEIDRMLDDNDRWDEGWDDSCSIDTLHRAVVLMPQAIEEGLWLDRKGILYEMSELEDHHIASILRFDDKFPAGYEPLVALVKKEKSRRDAKRKNKFFSESQVL